MPDIFLSYRSSDRARIAQLESQLRQRGVSTFYDRLTLKPGVSWFAAIEGALREAKVVAVFLGKGGLGPIQRREMEYALAEQAKRGDDQLPVVPVLIDGVESEEPPGFLRLNTSIDLRGEREARGLEQLIQLCAVGRRAREAPHFQPYRGLETFREEDSPFFFGRGAISERLLAAVDNHRLVAVVGASGSGKSSLVAAGLIPQLWRRMPPEQQSWECLTFKPGKAPHDALAAAIVELLYAETDAIERHGKTLTLAEQIKSSGRFIPSLVLNEVGVERCLIVADQFEELFTLVASDAERTRFMQLILELLDDARVVVLITLRADFFGHLTSANRALNDLVERGLVSIGPLTPEELRQAIEQPAALVHVAFEANLVERMLEHVVSEPGALPLLQFALKEMWNEQRAGTIPMFAYDRLGEPAKDGRPERPGLLGAVGRRAEETFTRLDKRGQAALLRVFTRLIRVAPSPEDGPDTRQRVLWSMLSADEKIAADSFVAQRLLVKNRSANSADAADAEIVEVAHEALIRHWERLRLYLDVEQRRFLTWRQRLTQRVLEWKIAKEDSGALLAGGLLKEATTWLRRRTQDLTSAEQRYIRVSRRHRLQSGLVRFAGVAGLLALAGFAWHRANIATTLEGIEKVPIEFAQAADDDAVTDYVLALDETGYGARALVLSAKMEAERQRSAPLIALAERHDAGVGRFVASLAIENVHDRALALRALIRLGQAERGVSRIGPFSVDELGAILRESPQGREQAAPILLRAKLAERIADDDKIPDPRNAEEFSRLALLALSFDNLPIAREAAERALKAASSKDNFGASVDAASALAAVGRTKEAVAAIKKALALLDLEVESRGDEQPVLRLAEVAASLEGSDVRKTLTAIDASLTKSFSYDSAAMRSLAGLRCKVGEINRAAELYSLNWPSTYARPSGGQTERGVLAAFSAACGEHAVRALDELARRSAKIKELDGRRLIQLAEALRALGDLASSRAALTGALPKVGERPGFADDPLTPVATGVLAHAWLGDRELSGVMDAVFQRSLQLDEYRRTDPVCSLVAANLTLGVRDMVVPWATAVVTCNDQDIAVRLAGRVPLVRTPQGRFYRSREDWGSLESSFARVLGRDSIYAGSVADGIALIKQITKGDTALTALGLAELACTLARTGRQSEIDAVIEHKKWLADVEYSSRYASLSMAPAFYCAGFPDIGAALVGAKLRDATASSSAANPSDRRVNAEAVTQLAGATIELMASGLTSAADASFEAFLFALDRWKAIPADDLRYAQTILSLLHAWRGDRASAEALAREALGLNEERSSYFSRTSASALEPLLDPLIELEPPKPAEHQSRLSIQVLQASLRLSDFDRKGLEPHAILMLHLVALLRESGHPRDAEEYLERLRTAAERGLFTSRIASRVFRTIATIQASQGKIHEAKQTAAACSDRSDVLRAYAAILRASTQQHPSSEVDAGSGEAGAIDASN